jgi:hypothetical protein
MGSHSCLGVCVQLIAARQRDHSFCVSASMDRVAGLPDGDNFVRVTFRPAVYRQSVRLGDKPLETQEQ